MGRRILKGTADVEVVRADGTVEGDPKVDTERLLRSAGMRDIRVCPRPLAQGEVSMNPGVLAVWTGGPDKRRAIRGSDYNDLLRLVREYIQERAT